MIPVLEIDAEGSIQYFGDTTALISIVEIKKGDSGFGQLKYRLKFIAFALGVLRPKLNLIIGDGLRMSAKNVQTLPEEEMFQLTPLQDCSIDFRLFLRSSSIKDFRK